MFIFMPLWAHPQEATSLALLGSILSRLVCMCRASFGPSFSKIICSSFMAFHTIFHTLHLLRKWQFTSFACRPLFCVCFMMLFIDVNVCSLIYIDVHRFCLMFIDFRRCSLSVMHFSGFPLIFIKFL